MLLLSCGRPLHPGRAPSCMLITALLLLTKHFTHCNACRGKLEVANKGIIADKDAELVRLRAEIGRLRGTLASSSQHQSSNTQELEQVQLQLQEAMAMNK